MLRVIRTTVFCLAILAFGGALASAVSAGTIIKLDLGGDAAADIQFDGTTLSTTNDGDAGTTGAQNTDADFLDFLSGFPDVLTPTASATLSGLTASGPAQLVGPIVVQNFTGGTFQLYDPANSLLLSGSLNSSALAGPIGPPATGALFTTTFASITGGQLASLALSNTLSLSMSFTDINGGAGFSVGGGAVPVLNPFMADTTLNIAADPIPEPAMAVLASMGGILSGLALRRRRR